MDWQRPSRRGFLGLSASAAIASLLPSRQVFGQTAAEQRTSFFESGKVPTLALEIAKEEMESLRREPRKYAKAQLKEEGGKAYIDVGVHTKGAAGSTRSIDEKAGLTFNMDKYEDGQRFYGMDKFHFNNCVQDPTYISELLCGEIYRAAGVPASRLTNCLVTLNGRKLGLYAFKEGYDKGFLKQHFGTTDGNFYDGGFLKDIDQPLENNGGKDDVKDHADLKSLVEVSREADHARRFDRMTRRLDVEKFATYLSLQMLTWDWDGYPTNRNNYRIYHDPKSKLLTFLPSGMDQILSDPNGPLFPGYQGLLAKAFIETPEGRRRYLARTEVLLKEVFVPDRWSKRMDEILARVQPVLKTVDEGAANGLPGQFNRLREGMKVRAKRITELLEQEKKKEQKK